MDREDGMKWRVVVELTGMDGTVQSHEVAPAATLRLCARSERWA
jgi:hypothetical protein